MVSSCESADQVALAGPAKTTQMIIYYVKKCTKQGPCRQWRLVGDLCHGAEQAGDPVSVPHLPV